MSRSVFKVLNLNGRDRWSVLLHHKNPVFSGTYLECEAWLDADENFTRILNEVQQKELTQLLCRIPNSLGKNPECRPTDVRSQTH